MWVGGLSANVLFLSTQSSSVTSTAVTLSKHVSPVCGDFWKADVCKILTVREGVQVSAPPEAAAGTCLLMVTSGENVHM